MRIDGVNAAESIGKGTKAQSQTVDVISKNLKNEISDVQRQKKSLSSKEDVSVREKTQQEKELQQEINGLNVQLRQRKEEMRREQKKDELSVELWKEEEKPEESKEAQAEETEGKIGEAEDLKAQDLNAEEKTDKEQEFIITEKREQDSQRVVNEESEEKDTGMSAREMQGFAEADTAVRQANSRERVITRMEDGVVLLKGEVKQDEARGVESERKKEEIEKQEKRVEKASESMFSALGEANKSISSLTQARADGKEEKAANAEKSSEDKVLIQAPNLSKQTEQAEQRFFINVK